MEMTAAAGLKVPISDGLTSQPASAASHGVGLTCIAQARLANFIPFVAIFNR